MSGGTTVPSIRPAPRMLEASRFGTNPARSIASRTFSRVAGATSSGLLITRDTVIGASPTCRAISRTPRRPIRLPARSSEPAAMIPAFCRPDSRL